MGGNAGCKALREFIGNNACSKSSRRLHSTMPRRLQSFAISQHRKLPFASAVYISSLDDCSSVGAGAKRNALNAIGGPPSGKPPKLRNVCEFLITCTRSHLLGCGRTRHKDTKPPWSPTASKHRELKKSSPEMTCWNWDSVCSHFSVFKSCRQTRVSVPPVAKSNNSGEAAMQVTPSRWSWNSALVCCRTWFSSVCTLTTPSHDAENKLLVPFHTAKHEMSALCASNSLMRLPLERPCAATRPRESPR
mmetsp:Transcript_3340/g.10033  ORF Transcript_3340/g.10033 Transcript_3340/m.10033 type:complete len:248 (-) Transcript_3340:396-1139(-)